MSVSIKAARVLVARVLPKLWGCILIFRQVSASLNYIGVTPSTLLEIRGVGVGVNFTYRLHIEMGPVGTFYRIKAIDCVQ